METNSEGIIYTKVSDHYIVGTDLESVNNNAVVSGNQLSDVHLRCYIDGIAVTRIGACSFRYNPSLQSLVISKTIKEIGFDAIAYITTLRKITIEKDSQLVTVEQGFVFNTSVTSFVIPPTVLNIGPYFFGLTSLDDLIYCSYQSEMDKNFFGSNTYTLPKRIHVAGDYPYSKLGIYTGELLADGICERIFHEKATMCINSYSFHSNIYIIALILS